MKTIDVMKDMNYSLALELDLWGSVMSFML